ncbi:MAG: capsular biosynthesis protein [Lachnospiraceae bacterium]|nr:capsular biosynthesis protein [Lachnospiraceae bacterium]
MLKLTDIHCHLIPYIDDGAKDKKEAKKLLLMEYKNGVRNIIVTPHYRKGIFESPNVEMHKKFQWLKKAAGEISDDLCVFLGCELYSSSTMVSSLQCGDRPTLAGSSYVLVEFSANHSYNKIRDQIYNLIVNGYKPVIAHIERYSCLRLNNNYIVELKDLGAFMQVNAGSILGEDGWKTKRLCKQLMKKDVIDFVGSDAHNTKERKPNLKECFAYVEKKMGKEYTYQLFVENPEKILSGK